MGPDSQTLSFEVKRSLRAHWPALVAITLLMGVAVLLDLVPPLVMRKIVDALSAGKPDGLWALSALYMGALVLAQTAGFMQNYLTAVVGQNILVSIRLLVVSHLEALPLSYFDRTAIGDTISRTTADVDAVNTLFTSGVIGMVTDCLRLVGVVAAMFVLSLRLTLVALLVLPVVIVLSEYFRRNIRHAERLVRKAIGVINTRLQECLSGHTVIRSHGCEERFLLSFEAALDDSVTATNRAGLFNAYFPPAMETLKALAIGLLLWFGARHLRAPLASIVTVGTLVAFVQLLGRMFGPITSLSDEFQTIQRAMTGIERIREVLEEPTEIRPSRAPARTRDHDSCVEIRCMNFGYLPDRPVVRDLNLTIESGQRIVIAGRTGAGKTSLLHLMSGLYQPWSGSITVSGISPSALEPLDRRRLIGVVPQTVHLFSGNLRENVTLGDQSISDEAVLHALRIVHLGSLVERLPLGLSTLLGPGSQQLSHGETQLLSLARALVADPPVLLLDEPSSGLDSETERTVFEALRDAGQGRTTITISHRLNNLVEADRLVILARGHIVQDGQPASLSGETGLYDALQELEQLGWAGQTGA